MELYDYKVDLKCLFSRNYTEDGDYVDFPGIQNASFYRTPNQMEGGLTVGTKQCKRSDSLIVERRFNFTQQLEKGHGKKAYQFIPKGKDEWEKRNKEMFSKHFRNPPNFLCNLTCLTSLMQRRNRIPKVIKANRFELDDGNCIIYLKFGFKSNLVKSTDTSSFHLESVLSTDSDRKGDINQTLVSLYEATLKMKNTNESIQFAFTAETDGLWENNQRPHTHDYEYTKDDIVEVKGAKISTLNGGEMRKGKLWHFFFEEQWLRTTWSNCRIRDLPTVLCGIMDDQTLNEVWLCNVNEIPRRVNLCSIKPGTEWRRAFPESIKLNGSGGGRPPRNIHLNAWTEDDCFGLLYNDLNLILSSFACHDPPAIQYFLQDDLTLRKKKGGGLEKVDKKDYEQLETLGRKRLLNFTKSNQKNIIRSMEKDIIGLKKVVKDIWASLGSTDTYRNVKGKTKNVQLKLEVERKDQVCIEVEFMDEICANHFQTKWNEWRDSEERKKKGFRLLYEMFVQAAVTARQQHYLKYCNS